MVCEVGCSKQLKLIAVEGKKSMYEGILTQVFAQYITDEVRREELFVKIGHLMTKIRKQKRKIKMLKTNMKNRCGVCFRFGAYLQE
jgi:hypothetical protein